MKQNLLTLCSFSIVCTALYAGTPDDGPPTTVPEPGSIVLLGTAAAGIGYAAWRRKRNQ
jgi:hypothetical protein